MFSFKSLPGLRLLKVFNHSERYISSLMPLSKSYMCGKHITLSKQTFHCRNIVNCNKKRNDVKRGDIEVYQTFVCFKYLRLIKNAVRESGPFLEENLKLAHVIKKAQNISLSSEFIDFAMKISCDVRANVGLFDVLLPSGCHFVIQYEDIDSTTTKHHLLELCERYEGQLIQGEAKWPQNFDQKGIITVRCNDPDLFSNESIEITLSKFGAESFHKEIDAEGSEYWNFYCDPWQLHEVKRNMHETTNDTEEAFVGYIPKKEITPNQQVRNHACNIFIELGKVPTIDNVYHNISVTE